jgi:hypothetical protein
MAPEPHRNDATGALGNVSHLCPGAQRVAGCIRIDPDPTFIPETGD